MIEDRDRDYDKDRYKAVIHYICHRVGADNLGSTKLNKILLEIDREAYLRNGKSITGVRYEKQEHGPVPRDLVSVRGELVAEGKLSFVPRNEHCPQDMITSLSAPNLENFTGEEIELINAMTDRVAVYSAVTASNRTHTDTWKLARFRAVIPHQAWLADTICAPQPSSVSTVWALSTFAD